jgi:hypothetical protein
VIDAAQGFIAAQRETSYQTAAQLQTAQNPVSSGYE